MRASRGVVAVLGVAVAASVLAAEGFNVPKGPCGSAPPAAPQRRKAGEGFPPCRCPPRP